MVANIQLNLPSSLHSLGQLEAAGETEIINMSQHAKDASLFVQQDDRSCFILYIHLIYDSDNQGLYLVHKTRGGVVRLWRSFDSVLKFTKEVLPPEIYPPLVTLYPDKEK